MFYQNYLKKKKISFYFQKGLQATDQSLPFKSSLFSLIELKQFREYKVQPISIFYSKIDGMPVEKKFRPFLHGLGTWTLFLMHGNFLV